MIRLLILKTSDLTNDSGYITGVSWNDVSNKPSFATVATSGSYNDLSNKPTIPTVNNATLTVQQNGTTVDTFTANSSSDKTVNIQCVDLSSNQTVGGIKTFSSNITIQGSYNGNEFSSNARTVLEFRANRDTANKSGIYLSKFRQNRAQGEMGYNDSHILTIDVLENEVRTNDLFRFSFKGWVNDVSTKAYYI